MWIVLQEQIKRKSTLTFLAHILMSVFGLISLFFVKKYMGYEAVGMIAFATSYMMLFSIIGDLGFGMAHLKRVGEGLDLAKCNGTIISIKLFLTFLMASAFIAWMLIQKFILGYAFESKEMEMIVYIIFLQYIIFNLGNPLKNIFVAKLEIAKSQLSRLTQRFVVMVLKIFVVIIGLNVIYLAYAELTGAIVLLILFLLLMRTKPISKPDKEYIMKYTTFAIPMIFIGIIAILSQNIDKLMLGFFFSSYEVGIYAIPQRLTSVLLIVSTSITGILFVSFSALYNNKELKLIRDRSIKAEKYISLILLPIVITTLIFSKPLLSIFGNDIAPSIPVLEIIIISVYFDAIRNPFSVQILSTGHVKFGFYLGIFTLVLNFILNLVLIPKNIGGVTLFGLGALGAAYALMLSFMVRAIIARLAAFKITHTKISFRIFLHFIAGIVFYSIVNFLQAIIQSFFLFAFVYLLLVVLLFFGLLYIFGEFTREDFEYLINALNPKQMRDYVSQELRK